MPVVVEVERIAGPGPATAANTGSLRSVSEYRRTVAQQGVTHGMFLVKVPDLSRSDRFEVRLGCNALTGSCPHIGNIEIIGTVIVVVEPGDAHASPHILDPRLISSIGKRAVAIVVIEILAAEVIDDIQVRPAV